MIAQPQGSPVPNSRLRRTIGRVSESLQPIVGLRDGVLGLRDGFLVLGAGLYAIGYVVWSLYAWLLGLGLLPVLSTQYIIAGITIGVFVVTAWLLASGLWLARSRLHAWLDKTNEWRLTLRWGLAALCNLAMLTFIVCSFTNPERAVWLIAVYLFALTAFFTTEVSELPRWLRVAYVRCARPYRWVKYRPLARTMLRPGGMMGLGKFYGLLFSILIPLICLALALLTFIYLPQELGGAHPVCTYLDIDRSMMSRQMQDELLPAADGSDARFVRTVRLDVLFAGGDSVLVRQHAIEAGRDRRIYDISSKLIASRVQCD